MTEKTRFFNLKLLLSGLLLVPFAAMASGSDCSDPVVIHSIPYQQMGMNTAGAGDNYSVSPCDDNYIGGDEYVFTYTPQANEYLSIRLENVDIWTGLHLLDACPDAATTCVASDLSSNAGSRAIDDIALTAGTTYFIIVSTFPTPQSTNFDIFLSQGNPPAAGTDCSNPLIINDLPFNDVAQNTANFGDNYSGTGPCVNNNYLNGDDILYRYTPPANESVTIELSNISGFFVAAQLMDGCVNGSPSCVAGAYNEVSTDQLELQNIYLEEGKDYYLVISTWENPQSVSYDLTITSNRLCEKPTNLILSNIDVSSATASWQGSSDAYDLAIVPAGDQPESAFQEISGTQFTASNLMAGQAYDVYVRGKCPPAPLMITGVYDGPLSGGNPKGVELYAAGDIDDLSDFGIGSANNGGGTDGKEYAFPAVSVAAGTFIYWASDADLFAAFFGFQPDYTDSHALINGNDAVELFEGDVVIDQFGYPNIDGIGQPWEYKDGWAYRQSRQENNRSAFDDNKWYYSGLDNLEGGPTNNSCDAPFPLGSFEPLPVLNSTWQGPVSFITAPPQPVCGGQYFDNGGVNANYRPNSNDTITICPNNAGYRVSVKFDLFDLQAAGEQCIDELYVFNGDHVNAEMISPSGNTSDGWCWDLNNSPVQGSGDLKDQVIESTHSTGCLTFVFRSDSDTEGAGWAATVSCMPVENCVEPADLVVSDVSQTSARLSWVEVSENAQTADVSYGPAGMSGPQAGTLLENISGPYELSGLMPSSAYDVYVRQQCGVFGTSEWIGPQRFLTGCSSAYGDDIINPIQISALPYSGLGSTKDCFTDNTGNSSADAYYSFTTDDCIYSVRISTCNEISDFDTYLRLLDSLGNEISLADDATTEQCSNSIDGLNRLSVLETVVQPNTKYFVVVEGYGPNEGLYQLDVEEWNLPYIQTEYVVRNNNCFGGKEGVILVKATQGAAPYTYHWSHGPQTNSISDLAAGTYVVTITDACDFSLVEEVVLTQPQAISMTSTITPESQNGLANGAVELVVEGGTTPYQFSWDNGEKTKNLADLSPGTYCVTITDRAGCTASECFEVGGQTVGVQQIDELLSIEVLPNPSSHEAFIHLHFREAVDVELTILSATGQLMDRFADRQLRSKRYELAVADYPEGVYFVQVNYRNYVFAYKLVVSR